MNETLFKFYHNSYFVLFVQSALNLNNSINLEGDIVVFKNHISIVSDNRNRKGISFVIHNANSYQKYYEEVILEYHNDLVGHYRIS